jgi:hypothetical protein
LDPRFHTNTWDITSHSVRQPRPYAMADYMMVRQRRSISISCSSVPLSADIRSLGWRVK